MRFKMLKTERLTLRQFNDNDFEDYYEVVSPFAKEYLKIKNKREALKPGLVNEPQSIKSLFSSERFSFIFRYSEIISERDYDKNNFEGILKSQNECAICLNSNQKLIGKISFSPPRYYIPNNFPPIWSREMGVILNRDYRNQGYMTEAVKCIVKYVMTETELKALYARILSNNGASLRLFDKCGFKFLCERDEDVNMGMRCAVTSKGIKKEELPSFYDNVNYETI